jgi:hypothetical protein
MQNIFIIDSRIRTRDVVRFIRQSSSSTLITLSTEKYWDIIGEQSTDTIWIIDYFAPVINLWYFYFYAHFIFSGVHRVFALYLSCGNSHPKFLQSIFWFKLSISYSSRNISNGINLKVGTVNCQAQQDICEHANVKSYENISLFFIANLNKFSYPKSILYSDVKVFELIGFHTTEQILEFIEESLHPSVVLLNPSDFNENVLGRPNGSMFLVDFFVIKFSTNIFIVYCIFQAPWCGPCQQVT